MLQTRDIENAKSINGSEVRMRGTITRIFPNKGYGFIRDEEGFLRFAHANQFRPRRAFDMAREGQGVEFDPLDAGEGKDNKKANGLRADNIHVLDRL